MTASAWTRAESAASRGRVVFTQRQPCLCHLKYFYCLVHMKVATS